MSQEVQYCFPFSRGCSNAFLFHMVVSQRRRLFPTLHRPPPSLHILLHLSSSLSHGNFYIMKLKVKKIALPCFQYHFHTSSPYFVFRFFVFQFFSFDLLISSSSISISVSFSFHLLLHSIFFFQFCPNLVSLFDFVTMCDFATAK